MAEVITHPIVSSVPDTRAPNEAYIGTNKLVLSDHSGMVVLHFDKRVDFCALTPEEARTAAEAIARQAYRVHFGDYPTTTDRSAITEQRRIRGRNRMVQILRKKTWKTEAGLVKLSSELVDQMMKIFLE